MNAPTASGPLQGIRVVDVSALAPGPFCTMILADFGADVIAIERPTLSPAGLDRLFMRGKRSVVLDLKTEEGLEATKQLVDSADVFVEGFRPGKMEELGLGPSDLMARNPRLVYARLTGWGQDGPYAHRAGHDVNYISIAGALGIIGNDGPVIPATLAGDFAGGSLMTVQGILMALIERNLSGKGQVIDAAMVDGAALLISAMLELQAEGKWGPRGTNVVTGAAPFYTCYECADGGWFSVGAMEPQFYRAFIETLGLEPELAASQMDRTTWPALRKQIADTFATRSRDQWAEAFAKTDGCGTPVLELDELSSDPHIKARQILLDGKRGPQAAPAPRFGRTPGRAGERPEHGEHTLAVLAELRGSNASAGAVTDSSAARGPDEA